LCALPWQWTQFVILTTTKYRVYTVGRDGRFLGPPKEMECADDEEIVIKALRMASGLDLEIWDHTPSRQRIKSTIPPA
jgi:hypothetical protein